MLMRDAEGRKKEASKVKQTNKQGKATQLTQHMYMYMYMLMRDEKEGREKQARSNKQQGKATQHIQGSLFSQEK